MYRRSRLSAKWGTNILAGKRSASRTEISADRRKGRALVTCFRGASKAVTSAQGRLTRAHRCGREGPGGLPKREGCQDRPQLESGLRRRCRICVTLPNSAMRARSSLPGQRHREGHRQCMEYPLVYISADREVDQPGLCMIPSAGGPLRRQRSRKAS